MKQFQLKWQKSFLLPMFLMIFFLSRLCLTSVSAEEQAKTAANAILKDLSAIVGETMENFRYKDVMTIYISGIDTLEDMGEDNDSDVNILLIVNTKTKQVLLVNTPRDYYVPLTIAEEAYDKLNYAANYGVNSSISTLEKLYDTEIDYYLRFNFTGFVNIIDALGGVSVYSDYEFDTKKIEGYHFYQGENEMDGAAALAFVRENYIENVEERQRGKNAMHVIEGVVKKLSSTDLLNYAEELLSGIKDSYETDIPYGTLLQFVVNEHSYLKNYEVENISVNGYYDYRWSYSKQDTIRVMIPDDNSIAEVKARMAQTREE